MTSKATKRIPVSKERWKELGKMKGAGQTYDELLKQIIQAYNRLKLKKKMDKLEKADKEELVPLNEL